MHPYLATRSLHPLPLPPTSLLCTPSTRTHRSLFIPFVSPAPLPPLSMSCAPNLSHPHTSPLMHPASSSPTLVPTSPHLLCVGWHGPMGCTPIPWHTAVGEATFSRRLWQCGFSATVQPMLDHARRSDTTPQVEHWRCTSDASVVLIGRAFIGQR